VKGKIMVQLLKLKYDALVITSTKRWSQYCEKNV